MLSVRNLSKSIVEGDKKRLLFADVNIDFPSYGLFIVTGPSGSGKSTFLHILASLEKADDGEILYEGKDVMRLSQKEACLYRQRNVAFLFQHHYLDGNLTAIENVIIPLLINDETKADAIRRAERLFADFSLSHLAYKKASLLSGGEKSRVAFLRAVIKEPPLLFCDEPTGALDHKNAIFIMEILKKYAKTHLVLMVSHDLNLAKKFADVFLRLEKGSLSLARKGKQKEEAKTPLPVSDRKEKRNRSGGFSLLRMLGKRKFKKERRKDVISFAIGTMMFLSLLLFFGFWEGGSAFLSDGEDRSLLYLSSSLAKKKKTEISGTSLYLTRMERPMKNEAEEMLSSFPSAHLENDYSFFFPSSLPYRQNGYLKESVSFCPIWDISLSNRSRHFLLEGECPSGSCLDYVLVNEAMAALLDDPIEALIDVSYETNLSYREEKYEFSFSFRFIVLGIVKDFAFLSLPRVYYSYPAFEMKAKEMAVADSNVYSLVENALPSEEISSYSYHLFFDESDAKALKKTAGEMPLDYELSNVLWSSQEAFSSLWQATKTALLPFLVAEIALAFFALSALINSSFVEQRRFLALLDALGMPKGWRIRFFEDRLAVNSLLSLLFAFLLSYPLAHLCSSLLEARFSLDDLISVPYFSFEGIPLFLPCFFLLMLALLILFAARLPLLWLSRKSLSKELKEE